MWTAMQSQQATNVTTKDYHTNGTTIVLYRYGRVGISDVGINGLIFAREIAR
jgi:hypothetical protein